LGKRGNGNAAPAVALANDAPVACELGEESAERLVAQAERGAQRVARGDPADGVDGAKDFCVEHGGWGGRRVDGSEKLEMGGGCIACDQGHLEGIWGRGGAVFDGDGEVVFDASDVEGTVGPGMEVAGAPEALTCVGACGTILSCVMGNDDGNIVRALELTEKGEKSRDLGGTVFVDAMKADEGVE
jgi:hypothetical protein